MQLQQQVPAPTLVPQTRVQMMGLSQLTQGVQLQARLTMSSSSPVLGLLVLVQVLVWLLQMMAHPLQLVAVVQHRLRV